MTEKCVVCICGLGLFFLQHFKLCLADSSDCSLSPDESKIYLTLNSVSYIVMCNCLPSCVTILFVGGKLLFHLFLSACSSVCEGGVCIFACMIKRCKIWISEPVLYTK